MLNSPLEKDLKDSSNQMLIVKGGKILSGTIRNIGGAKNASTKLMIASCLANSPTILNNMPVISDITLTAKMLSLIGVKIEFSIDKTKLKIDPSNLNNFTIPVEVGEHSRAALLTVGLLLSKFGKAIVPYPGGDKLGKRALDIHFEGLQQMGAQIVEKEENIVFNAPKGLHGIKFHLRIPTLMGTEQLLIAAVKAQGITILQNCAQEPELDCLINHLLRCGANIKVIDNRKGRTITIKGVNSLTGTTTEIIPDQNTAVTYAVAALATESRQGVFVQGAKSQYLQSFLCLIKEMNGGYEEYRGGIKFFLLPGKKLIAPKRVIISGRPTGIINDQFIEVHSDWQPLLCVLFLKAEGKTTLIETRYTDRFYHLRIAQRFGACVEFFNPQPIYPEIKYYFMPSSEQSQLYGAYITGNQQLAPMHMEGRDVRSGAFGVVTGLMRKDKQESIITDITHLQRGYHHFVDNLSKIGAKIELINSIDMQEEDVLIRNLKYSHLLQS